MSKLRNPLLSFDAHGTIGRAITFVKRRGATLAEKKPEVPNARSLAQLSWRHMYLKAVALWHALSAAEQQEWESSARPKHMTGFAWFMSQALKPNPGLYLPLQGGTMSGDIDMGSNKITDLLNPTNPQDAVTKAIITAHQNSLTPHLLETLAVLLSGSPERHIPTTGWDITLVGSGGVLQGPTFLTPSSGVTPNSSALAYTRLYGFGSNVIHRLWINWDKKLYIIFRLNQDGSHPTISGRFQLKQVNTIGALAAKGLELTIDDLALTGASYGTAPGTKNLGVSLTLGYGSHIMIVHYPGEKIEWYVNWAKVGTQSTGNTIPSGTSTAPSILMLSAKNAAVGVTGQMTLMQPIIWQEP